LEGRWGSLLGNGEHLWLHALIAPLFQPISGLISDPVERAGPGGQVGLFIGFAWQTWEAPLGIAREILEFIERRRVLSVAMTDGIIGCPHQEGIDYEGEWCPLCEFWHGRDRFTGQPVN